MGDVLRRTSQVTCGGHLPERPSETGRCGYSWPLAATVPEIHPAVEHAFREFCRGSEERICAAQLCEALSCPRSVVRHRKGRAALRRLGLSLAAEVRRAALDALRDGSSEWLDVYAFNRLIHKLLAAMGDEATSPHRGAGAARSCPDRAYSEPGAQKAAQRPPQNKLPCLSKCTNGTLQSCIVCQTTCVDLRKQTEGGSSGYVRSRGGGTAPLHTPLRAYRQS